LWRRAAAEPSCRAKSCCGNGDAGIGELVLERLVDSIRTSTAGRQPARPNRFYR
jgi:hypothetical protein